MISVIIPVYNVEPYLFACRNSVLGQSVTNFEIICNYDTSTDLSLDVLKYFAKKDSRVKILQNETNMGPGYSRNRGLEIAEGKYISFRDDDDFLSQEAFEILVKKVESDGLDVLTFKNIVLYENKNDFGMGSYYDMKFMDEFENKIFNHWDLDKTKLFEMSNALWNKFYLKSFLGDNNIRFPNENRIHEDNPFFYGVITSAERISIINFYFHNRRRKEGSIMTLTNERLFDNIDIAKIVLDYFIKNLELYDYYKKDLLTYIFNSLFNAKYHKIDSNLKEEFYIRVQDACRIFIKQYGLYDDITENVCLVILEFFKFDDWRCEDD